MLWNKFNESLLLIKPTYSAAMIKTVDFDYRNNEYVGRFTDPTNNKVIEVRYKPLDNINQYDIMNDIQEFEFEKEKRLRL